MDIDELRQKQANFEGIRQDRLRNYKKLEEFQKKFVKTFPLSRISDLHIDDYVEGKLNKNSFCYWVECKTKTLGGMQGATA